MTHVIKKSSDASTIVTSAYYYSKITDPIAQSFYGSKCFLINRYAGVCYEGILRPSEKFATHFAPVPMFHPDDKKEPLQEGRVR